MPRTLGALAALVLAFMLASCSQDVGYTVGPDEAVVLAGKGDNKGGGGGSSAPITIDMTGGFEAVAQAGQIVSDNRNRTELAGPGDCDAFGCVDYAFAFSDKVDTASCETDPADMDEATRQELFDHLDDPLQNRTFSAVIEKNGSPKTRVGAVYIDDANGQKYKIEISDASAAQDPTDHYVITGGIVWTVKDGFGAYLICPFTGAQELTVTR